MHFKILSEEELVCLAEWREGTNNYLVGKLNYRLAVSNEERYRCFIYEFVKGHTVVKIAVSGDATCNGLASPTEGEKTMTFTKGVSLLLPLLSIRVKKSVLGV